MTSRGSQNWPVVQDRPSRAHHQARPERTDTLLKLRLSVATPAKFLAPWADGQAEQTCARRGEPMEVWGRQSGPTERGRSIRAKLARIERRRTRSAGSATGETVAAARVRQGVRTPTPSRKSPLTPAPSRRVR